MPNVICQHCGGTAGVQGLAAICPYCGMLITVSQETATQIDPISAAEAEFQPKPLPRELPEQTDVGGGSNAMWWMLGAAVGVIIILVVALILVLASRNSTPPPTVVVQAPPPSKPVTTTKPQANKGSEWFSENAATTQAAEPASDATQVAQAPVQSPLPKPAAKPVMPASAPSGPHAELATIKPMRPDQLPKDPRRLTDEQIGNALTRGINYLNSQFAKTRLKNADAYDPEVFAGMNALAVYAWLHATQASGETKINPQNDLVKGLLDRLKEFPMSGEKATYSRSLRISALTVLNRPEDKGQIDTDLQWLLKASMRGAYTYNTPTPDQARDRTNWDNSNSQYGALGVWAASEAGFKVPATYWNDVEQHWTSAQVLSGGWGYGPGATAATLAMTCAGTTMLFVSGDQFAISAATSDTQPPAAYQPLSKALTRAMEWLDESDNAINVDNGHRGYTLYGLERVGLASGYKFFGTHDWYLELASKLVAEQKEDGSWTSGDGQIPDTAFNLLFLSRGRHPVFMAKLKFDGSWNNRPRDVDVFTRFAANQLERPLNWQVADIQRDWWDWTDAPTLLITSDKAPNFKDSEVDKLRSFVQAGGMIFLNSERNSEEFSRFAADLASRLFPEYPLAQLPPDHGMYSIVFPLNDKKGDANLFRLRAVSNGSRMLLIHSPTDLSRLWQPHPMKSQRMPSELAMNIAVYATGRRDLRNRLASSYIREVNWKPVGTVPIARLRYKGNWDPEPSAWPRTARLMQLQTGIALNVMPMDLVDLKYDTAPIAVLTGTDPFQFNENDITAIRLFVTRGGVLLIDSCAGNQAFADFIQTTLLPKLFLDAQPSPLPTDHPLLIGSSEGMTDIHQPRLRLGVPTSPLLGVHAGKGQILFSRLDLTSGLLGTNTVGIAGYQPAYCQEFVRNLVLWEITRLQSPQ